MRDTFVATLLDIAKDDPSVILLTADLGFGVLDDYQRQLPKQFINVGVAEQNLIGVATGLAMSGHVVFAYSIGNFPTLRCLEQIRNDACYHSANVKIVAVGAGFSYGSLGISHHATEDLAVLRSIPDLTILSPCDQVETIAATRGAYKGSGTVYLRLDKSSVRQHTPSTLSTAIPGAVRQLCDGSDVAIFGTGGILAEALNASAELRTQGISCAVYSVHTIAPLDCDAVLRAASQVKVILTLEEHTIRGGLGSAIGEVLIDAGAAGKPVIRIGLTGGFSSIVGNQEYLRAAYRMDARSIISAISNAINRD